MAKGGRLLSRSRGYIGRVGRLDAKIGSEIVRIVEAKLIASENERLVSYDDSIPIIAHCSYCGQWSKIRVRLGHQKEAWLSHVIAPDSRRTAKGSISELNMALAITFHISFWAGGIWPH